MTKLLTQLYVGGAIGNTQESASAYRWLDRNRDLLDHAASHGCWLAIIRELTTDPYAYVQNEIDEDGQRWWIVWSTMGVDDGPCFMVGVGETEIEALHEAILGFIE